MSTPPSFSAQALGQTEKALNAILDRRLAGTGLTERQWIALSLLVMSGGNSEREALVERVTGGAKGSGGGAGGVGGAPLGGPPLGGAPGFAGLGPTAGRQPPQSHPRRGRA